MATKLENLISDIKELLPHPVTDENLDLGVEQVDLGIEELVNELCEGNPLFNKIPHKGVRLIGGDPSEVVAFVTEEVINFSQFALVWTHPHIPTLKPIPIASIQWRNLRKPERQQIFTTLVETISKRRRKLYRICQYCERLMPPEWLFSDTICHSCAEKHLGVTF